LEIGIGIIALSASIATGIQAYIANDTEKRSLRAYVFVEKASVVLDGNTLKAVIDLKNGGQTPAYNLTTSNELNVAYANKPFVPLMPLPVGGGLHGIVGPGAIVNPRIEMMLPPQYPDEAASLNNGSLVVYFFGKVEYTDAFQRTWILEYRMRSYNFATSGGLMVTAEDGNKEYEKPPPTGKGEIVSFLVTSLKSGSART
jgi:hypothetical protein